MAKRGRKTLYSTTIAAEIVKLLSSGCIIDDVCAKVGINPDTYFEWVKVHSDFSDLVERAKADAKLGAVLSLRKAMMPHDILSRTVKTFTETRLRKAKDTDGNIFEAPYEYKKIEQSETVSNEFDWRAALEFLKRRDPDNWSEHLIIRVNPEDSDLLKKLGWKSPTDAFEKFLENARDEYAAAIANS